METIYDEEQYDILHYYDRLLGEYNSKGLSVGLDKDDMTEIIRIINELYLIKNKSEIELHQLNSNYGYVLECQDEQKVFDFKSSEYIKASFVKNMYNNRRSSIRSFIVEINDIKLQFDFMLYDLRNKVNGGLGSTLLSECSLVHLVYANNKDKRIKLYSVDSFMFLCQFHVEKTPSFGVSNKVECAHCFGCGKSMNAIQYIMMYEGMSYHQAVCLLARIYLIDIDNNIISEDDARVIKYRLALLSDGFRDLLNRGYQRTFSRKDQEQVSENLDRYMRHFDTIDRIKRDEHINYQDITLNKRLFLDIK